MLKSFVDRQTNGQTYGCMDGWMEGWMVRAKINCRTWVFKPVNPCSQVLYATDYITGTQILFSASTSWVI